MEEAPPQKRLKTSNFVAGAAIKVKMSGVAGDGVVDLTTLDGYDQLVYELEKMFDIKGQLQHRNKWEIIYVDHEGDTILLGDEPWPEFCQTVRGIFICSSQDMH